MRTGWKFGVAAVMVGALSGSVTTTALAQPPRAVSESAKQLARKNYTAAEAKYQAGNYSEALGLYEQAEATIPVPQTKYKIASCHDRLGHKSEALRWYQVFLDSVPPEKAEKLAVQIADARSRLSALNVTAPAQVRLIYTPTTARVLVSTDGGPQQYAGANVALLPGHHRLVFQADGFTPFTTDIDVAPGDAKELRFALQPRAIMAAPAPRPIIAVTPPPAYGPQYAPVEPVQPHRRSNVPSYVLFGLTGAGIIVGSAFGAIALQDKSNFNAHPTTSGADTTHDHALASDVSFSIAGAFGVTGIILLVTNLSPRAAQVGQYVTPYGGPGSAGATAHLSF